MSFRLERISFGFGRLRPRLELLRPRLELLRPRIELLRPRIEQIKIRLERIGIKLGWITFGLSRVKWLQSVPSRTLSLLSHSALAMTDYVYCVYLLQSL